MALKAWDREGVAGGKFQAGQWTTLDLTADSESPWIALPEVWLGWVFIQRTQGAAGGGAAFGLSVELQPDPEVAFAYLVPQLHRTGSSAQLWTWTEGSSMGQLITRISSDAGSLHTMPGGEGARLRVVHTADGATQGSGRVFLRIASYY